MNYDCSKCPVMLESFCEKDRSRYKRDLPFRRGDYVYATDGHIIVRVPPESYSGQAATEGKFPRVEDLGWGEEVVKWGKVPEPRSCKHCKNQRSVPIECGRDEYNDAEYDENVRVPCPKCCVKIQGQAIAWHLVEPLTRFADELECGIADGDGPVHFRFDGGNALVMPLKDSEK